MKLARSIWPGFFALCPRAGLWVIYLLRGMRRFRPAYARLDTGGFPRHGRQCIPIRHARRTPSLPSVLDFLAAKWLQETDLNRRYTAYEAAVLPLHHPAMCRGLTAPRRYKIGDMPPSGVGADSGNRTHVFGLECRRSAVELHPRVPPKGLCERRYLPPVFPGCQVTKYNNQNGAFRSHWIFARPRSCAVWGVSGRRAAHRHKEEV